MNLLALALFVVTYILISARRLSWLGFDRPAGALLGAVAFVVFRVLSPTEAIQAVNGETLLLLFGVMGMGAFLALDGFFDGLEHALCRVAKTPARLLGWICWSAGILSALITNDAVCVLGAPLVVRLIEKHRLPPLPYLLALCTAANTGSVASLVGNPQNMLCAVLGHLEYRDHLLLVGPLALICLALNHGFLWLLFKGRLPKAFEAEESAPVAAQPHPVSQSVIPLCVIGGTVIAYSFGADLAWSAAAGFVTLMLIRRRDTRELWHHIDWSLLVFFAALFIAVEGFMKSGAPQLFFERFSLSGDAQGIGLWARISGIFLVGSNIVSNVPFILVIRDQMANLPNPQFAWELLTVASTFAGNLTLLGSVANVIVAENARHLGGLGFFEYLRAGFPIALATTVLGTVWLYAFM